MAKIDEQEALAEWRARAALIVGLIAGLAGIVGVAGLLVWENGRKSQWRALYRSEVALRASIERQSVTLRSIGDGVIATDADGRVELMNPIAEVLTGWSLAEARGRPLEEVFRIINEWTRADVDSPVRRVLRDGVTVGLANHTVLLARDGRELPIADSGAPIRDPDGAITGVVMVFQDQSAERAREAEREHMRAAIEQAHRMESVGRLAGGVAHDFNNMLSVIIGYAETALDDAGDNGQLRGDIGEILKAANRSADITRQLLAFARKQTIAPETVDLNRAVKDLLTMLARLVGEDVTLDWRPGADLWPVRLDPTQLVQILTNLCLNARDAIAGEGTVTIETANVVLDAADCAGHADAEAGDYVALTVGDDGCGMDRETVESIFEPFFTTKGGAGGTGLGLATVYGIVSQSGGFITVESAPGRGSSFRIHLPRRSGAVDPALAGGGNGAPVAHGETILVVEDEPAILRLTSAVLQRLGYDVLAAGGPQEALDLAEGHDGRIDLLLTDVVMPGMNGRVLSDSLRGVRAGLRTLYMSGYTAEVIARRGVLAPGEQLLHKPFTTQALAERIRAVLDGPDQP